jgi:hypothetical protein
MEFQNTVVFEATRVPHGGGPCYQSTACCELPYSVLFSLVRLRTVLIMLEFVVGEVVRNSIIASMSQANREIIGTRFSTQNSIFVSSREGLLSNRKPATIFSPTLLPFYVPKFRKLNKYLVVVGRATKARPAANFHTRFFLAWFV